jgi:hypothetical protein
MTEFKVPSWAARNPLGIVALFISLIYGMSALLLGASIKQLLPANQTILVIFVVLFPILVLAVFGWLVSCHHTKLYGPGDYRNDQSFLDAGRSVDTNSVGRKLEEEIQKEEATADQPELATEETPDAVQLPNEQSGPPTETPEQKFERLIFTSQSNSSSRLNQAYVAEGLVFQALQSEFGGSIRRGVSLSGQQIDGLLYRPDGNVTAVEVKIWSSTVNFQRRLREAHQLFQSIKPAMVAETSANVSFLLAIVLDGNPGRVAELKDKIARTGVNFGVRVYGAAELFQKYGFSP